MLDVIVIPNQNVTGGVFIDTPDGEAVVLHLDVASLEILGCDEEGENFPQIIKKALDDAVDAKCQAIGEEIIDQFLTQ